MRRGCPTDTNEMFAEYASQKSGVNVSHWLTRPSPKCQHPEPRAGDVKARSRVHVHARAARSAAALYVAEHGSILEFVMADSSHDAQGRQTMPSIVWQTRGQITCAIRGVITRRPTWTRRRTPAAQLREVHRLFHATRHDVNDPSRSGAGATRRSREGGRSRHGVLIPTHARCRTGGTERRPLTPSARR